jgi:hypothetical protein
MAGILSDIPYGALSSTPDQPAQQPVGVLDPRYFALLNAGMSMMANSGPSLQPRGMGQILGQAGQAGLNSFMQARKLQQQEADSVLRRKLLTEQVRKAQMEADLRSRLAQGGAINMDDPSSLERYGSALLAGGEPGGATLISQAEKIRQRQAEQQQVESFKSRPGVLGAGVTTTSPQGQALLSNLTGDAGFDQAILQAQNEALNSNPRLQPQPMKAPTPGLFSPLVTSPYVGPFAQDLQGQLDTTRGGLTPQQWLQQYDRLQGQHITSTNQATARGETADLRRELANQADNTRRMLAAQSAGARTDRQQDLDAQREFTRERSLANDYNALSKDFRTVAPVFESTARYVASGKYNSSGDRDLAFAFARTLDPKDRVGVHDIKDINKLGNLPERIQQAIIGLAEGKELPDRVRLEMFQAMRNRFQSLNDLQQQIEDEYEGRAKQYMLKPDRVVQRFSIRSSKPGGGGNGGWSATPVR